MSGPGRLSGGPEGEPSARRDARRSLSKSRFSVFDGGAGSDQSEGEREQRGTRREEAYHEECYACPVGKAFRSVSEATRSDALEGFFEAVADLVRAGTKLVETLAERASAGRPTGGQDRIERITVE